MRGRFRSLRGGSLLTAVLAGLLLLGGFAGAQAGSTDGPHVDFHDHPDVGWSPSLAFFPDHDEVNSRVDALVDHPWMNVTKIAESEQGRAIRLVEVVDPDSAVPMDERAVTLLLTQQHGNEPAGTPAVLDLLERIADGDEIKQTLENQILLVIPMMNPDGAEEAQRANADGVDINRDHNDLGTSEARALHDVLTDRTVHVAIDHHEYGGTGLGNPAPVRVYDYDLTTLMPTHASVDPSVVALGTNLMQDGIWPRAEEEGYTANEYGEVTAAGVPLGYLAGGPDPGILRNHLGIHHIAGILVETRIDAYDNPFHDAERREHIQYLSMVGTLEYVHEHAGLFVAMQESTMKEHAREAPKWYDQGDFPFLTDDSLDDQEAPRAEIPAAYQVAGDEQDIVDLLGLHGLPPGAMRNGTWVHNVDHAWPVHSAALFSDASSRQVFEAEPTEPVAIEDPEVAAADDAEAAPGVGVLVVLLVLFAATWRRGRRFDPHSFK